MNKKISIIMLNYNGLHYLKKTVPVILDLTYLNFELIVVDNASNDGSIPYLETFGNKINLIRNSSNLGYSAGKNIGCFAATGDYLFLLDNDILINDINLLDYLLEKTQQIGEKNILSLVMLNSGEEFTKYYSYCYGFLGPIYNKGVKISNIIPSVYESGAPMGGNMFLAKQTWDNIGGFDNMQPYYLDDFDFGARGSIYGFKSFISSERILSHLGVDQALSEKKWLWKYKYFFSGYSTVMLKNYTLSSFILRYPVFIIYTFLKTFKYSLKFLSPKPFLSLFWSIQFFSKNILKVLSERKIIQEKRIEISDIFFKIKPPKF